MEVATCASGARSLNCSSYVGGTDKFVIGKPNGFLRFSCNKQDGASIVCMNSQRSSVTPKPPKFVDFERSCLYKNAQGIKLLTLLSFLCSVTSVCLSRNQLNHLSINEIEKFI